ncbi:MAG: autotransporter-associated beta strand repeat-containing protein, partial [bacterium]
MKTRSDSLLFSVRPWVTGAARLFLLAVAAWAGTATAGTFSWNVGSAAWNDSSANWSGDGTVWVDGSGNEAVFNNTPSATTVTVDGARTAGAVKVGNNSINANYTFCNGTGGSLSVASFVVQGDSSLGGGTGWTTPTVLDNVTLTTTGNLGIGRWMLVIKGASTVSVGGKITWDTAGIISADWGALTIEDTAAVTATLGVDSYDHVWNIFLNGGSLTTPVLRAIDGNWGGREAHLTFNGGTLIASASNADFLQINQGGRAWVNSGGAKIDSGVHDIAINSKLIHDSSGPATDGGLTKSGTGTLTLSGVNTYNGDTTVTAGTLAVTGKTVLPSATDVSVASEAFMALSFSGTNTVNSLTLGGVLQRSGTWGADGSGARFTSSQFTGAGVLLASTGSEATYSWNAGDGAWDVATANWSGAGTVWQDENRAGFTNQSGATSITVCGPRNAVDVKVGNNGNNANYTFSNGVGGSLTTDAFLVQGDSGNGSGAGVSAPTIFDNLTLSTVGNIGVGRWALVIGGSSAVNAGGQIGGNIAGISSADWGTLTIQDSAVVTASGGVNGNTGAWSLNLNGGTLVTKSIQASEFVGGAMGTARLTFNGTIVKPTQDNDIFVTVSMDYNATYSALVGNAGAIFDSNGYNIGIPVSLKQGGSGGLTKQGAGTLTLSGTNTYTGGTAVNGGTLRTRASNSIGSGPVTVAFGATWEIGLANQAVAGLSGAGNVTGVTGVTTGTDGAALISAGKNYVQLLDFGNGGGATVNGVAFAGVGTS